MKQRWRENYVSMYKDSECESVPSTKFIDCVGNVFIWLLLVWVLGALVFAIPKALDDNWEREYEEPVKYYESLKNLES